MMNAQLIERQRVTTILRADGAKNVPQMVAALIDGNVSADASKEIIRVANGGRDGRFGHLAGPAAAAGLERWVSQYRTSGDTANDNPSAVVDMARRGMPHLFATKGGPDHAV
jgi:hypothetical protein